MKRLTGALLGALVVVCLWTTPSAAHAELRATEPSNGARLDRPPARVVLTFTEAVDPPAGGIRVYDSDETRLERGRPYHPAGRRDQAAVDLPGLDDGGYVVTWRVVSADGHPIKGAFTFGVGDRDIGGSQELAARLLGGDTDDPLVGALYAAARVLLFASLLFLIGSVTFVVAWWSAGWSVRRVRRAVQTALILGAVATVAAVGLQGAQSAGFGLAGVVDLEVLSGVLDTRFGQAGAVRLALLGLAALLLWSAGRRTDDAPRRWQTGAGASIALGLLATVAGSGHATTGRWVGAGLAADFVHLGAAALWLGGLGLLAISAVREDGSAELEPVLPRFSRMAFICVVTLLGTGSFQSFRQVGGLDALTGTDYGRLLMVKFGLFVVMVVLATRSRTWVRSRLRSDPADADTPPVGEGRLGGLRRAVAAEALVGLLVVVVTALLVNAVPGRTALALPQSIEMQAGDELLVEVTVDPAKAGPVDVHLYTLTPSGLPAEAEGVTAQLVFAARDLGPVDVPLQRAGPNHFAAYGFEVPISGRWRLNVIVSTSDGRRVPASGTLPIR